MFSLEIECDPEDRDLLIAELWEQGSEGIVELKLGPFGKNVHSLKVTATMAGYTAAKKTLKVKK